MFLVQFVLILITSACVPVYSTSLQVTCDFEIQSRLRDHHIDSMSWSCEDQSDEQQKSGKLTSLLVILQDDSYQSHHNFSQSMKNLRADISGDWAEQNRVNELSNELIDKLKNLDKFMLDETYLTEIHNELLARNRHLHEFYTSQEHLNIKATETFNLPEEIIADYKGRACINKWKLDSPRNETHKEIRNTCNPNIENIRGLSILMGKLINHLTGMDVELYKEMIKHERDLNDLENWHEL